MGRDELRRKARTDRFYRQTHGQMRLAHARRSQKQDVAGFMHKAQGLQFPELRPINAGLKGHIKLRQRLMERKSRALDGLLVARRLTRPHLRVQDFQQEVGVGAILLGSAL
jgi:hypothetical protein